MEFHPFTLQVKHTTGRLLWVFELGKLLETFLAPPVSFGLYLNEATKRDAEPSVNSVVSNLSPLAKEPLSRSGWESDKRETHTQRKRELWMDRSLNWTAFAWLLVGAAVFTSAKIISWSFHLWRMPFDDNSGREGITIPFMESMRPNQQKLSQIFKDYFYISEASGKKIPQAFLTPRWQGASN